MGGLGFKDFELFNLAMLAKQAWCLLQNLDSLSARLLKSIYYPNSNILEANLGGHPSQTWRAIMEGRDILKQGIIKCVGNGQTTRIWEDNWIPTNVMMRPITCLSNNPPTRVSKLIDATSATWRMERLHQFFLAPDVKAIASIPLCCWGTQ